MATILGRGQGGRSGGAEVGKTSMRQPEQWQRDRLATEQTAINSLGPS
jgi:hypothetical protein